MGAWSYVRSALESDWFSNTTSAFAAVVSVAALAVSIFSYQSATDAQLQQREASQRQGEFLTLKEGFVSLLQDDQNNWKQYGRLSPDDPVVEIPLSDWSNARARTITVRLANDGLQSAFLSGFYLKTGPQANQIYNDSDLQAKCLQIEGEDKSCPAELKPHDGYSLGVAIPDNYLRLVVPFYRQQGLVLCGGTKSGAQSCDFVGVRIPDGAFPPS
jgi:hypothetical protein